MSNGKKGSSAKSEQIVLDQPVIDQPVIDQPASDEQANGKPASDEAANQPAPPPVFMLPIIAAREAEDKLNSDKASQLFEAFINAKKEYVAANVEDNFAQTERVLTAQANVKLADEAITSHAKTIELLGLERAENDHKLINKYVLCEAFGIDIAALDILIAKSADVKDTLKPAFTAVFGKPVYFAKQGETSKALNANKKPASDANGDANGEAADDKKAEIRADLTAGMTYAELLQKYPTKPKDAPINYNKLNGTVRTVISEEGWSKQADGSYTLKAAE